MIDLCKICFQNTTSEKYSLHLSHTESTESTEFVCLAANGSHPYISHIQFSNVPNRKKHLFFYFNLLFLLLRYIIFIVDAVDY